MGSLIRWIFARVRVPRFCGADCRGIQSAAHFGVGISTVINWVRRFQDTGSVAAPGQMGGHKPKAIAGMSIRSFLAGRVREGGFTLRGLVAELARNAASTSIILNTAVWVFSEG